MSAVEKHPGSSLSTKAGDADIMPKCTIVAKTFGATSEVWLYRQAVNMSRLRPQVICWEQQNAEAYSLSDIPLVKLPYDAIPENGSGRWLRRLRNAPSGNYYGTLGSERSDISSALRDHASDIIICHFGPIALRVLPVAVSLGIPLVAHFHGFDISTSLKNKWYRKSLQRSLSKFAALVVVATYQRDALIELGADPNKIHVIPCGSPIAGEVTNREDAGEVDGGCRFIFVGRFVEKKDPIATLRAFASCRVQLPNVTLEMIGDGPLLNQCRETASELQLGDSVQFLGSQTNEIVMQRLLAADVFVQHSITAANGDKEGWPVSIAEAMGYGLPVVSTRHAGIVDQVVEGQTGYLVDEGDWQEMAARMVEIATPAVRSRMGNASKERATKFFDFHMQIAELETLLTQYSETKRNLAS
ncbi:glycosyltransferase [Blastopirellula marina]|nr:glycosyltransferase [Blastopirellula marina]